MIGVKRPARRVVIKIPEVPDGVLQMRMRGSAVMYRTHNHDWELRIALHKSTNCDLSRLLV